MSDLPARLVVATVGEPGPRGLARLRDLPASIALVDVIASERAVLAEARGLLVWDFRTRAVSSLLAELPALRWIQTASAGVDHMLDPAIGRAGITVTNAAGVFDRAIAEYVLGLVLAHAKDLATTIDAQREHRWRYRETRAVEDRLMVVVGLGRVGVAVARVAHGVGMRVLGVRRAAGTVDGIEVVGRDQLHEALRGADVVVVAAALTPATRGLIDAAAFAEMRPGAYFINVARAAIVDTDALVAALGRGQLAGAALDVFDQEPLSPDSNLWTTPGLLVSPHMSGDTDGWDERVVELFLDNARRFVRGEPLRNVVDLVRGY